MPLHPDSSVCELKGVGSARAEKLAQLDIRTLQDLLTYYPRSWEDRTEIRTIQELQPDKPACFTACVMNSPETVHIRNGLDLTKAMVKDQTGQLQLLFFNQKFTARKLRYKNQYVFYGMLSEDAHGLHVANPVFEALHAPGIDTRCIVPLYRLTPGISNAFLRNLIFQALEYCLQEMSEILPEPLLQEYGLLPYRDALQAIHNPKNMETLQKAKERLIFEESFIFSAGLYLRRKKRQQQPSCKCIKGVPASFYNALPFSLTEAQRQTIHEIQADMKSDHPMYRLIQGDTGCGKTTIAAAAVACAAENGFQSALMVPTTILAEQHYQSLAPLLSASGIRTVLLTGSTPASERRNALAAVSAGTVQLVIGTHAILNESVNFRNPGLVIADEQQRFGVAQRLALTQKGISPHILFMSATPIPRTLALTFCGDMDISSIHELPPGRQNVDTFLVGESMRQRVYAFIRKQVQAGHQAFVVCPLVEEDKAESAKAAVSWARTLQNSIFQDLSVATLHGRMSDVQKSAVMEAFSCGEIDILVCTTVIETGVDIPNATLMVIESADHFGLSQLHQLRGRVGRGHEKSWCILLTENTSEQTIKRLKNFTRTNDGFAVAEEDLQLRGPGDFLGTRQHGLPVFKCASLMHDAEILSQAHSAAETFLSETQLSDTIWQPLYKQLQISFPELVL